MSATKERITDLCEMIYDGVPAKEIYEALPGETYESLIEFIKSETYREYIRERIAIDG